MESVRGSRGWKGGRGAQRQKTIKQEVERQLLQAFSSDPLCAHTIIAVLCHDLQTLFYACLLVCARLWAGGPCSRVDFGPLKIAEDRSGQVWIAVDSCGSA